MLPKKVQISPRPIDRPKKTPSSAIDRALEPSNDNPTNALAPVVYFPLTCFVVYFPVITDLHVITKITSSSNFSPLPYQFRPM